MNQYKKLFNNSLIFAIGNLGSKLVTFLMLPLYTYVLSTSEYGVVDLMLTTTSLLLPIVGLSIHDSVLRFSMDKNYDKKTVFSNGFYVTLCSSVILIITIPFLSLYKLQMVFLPLLLIMQLFQNLFAQYAKAINKISIFALNGILLSFSTATLNILFLITLNMGVTGYLISLLLANFFSSIYLGIRLKVWRLVDWKAISKNEIIKQLRFSVPLISNSIAWWTTNAVGRYFILLYIGTAANGIYAVSNKIPTLLIILTSIFSQSWQISAIEGYEDKNEEVFLDIVYNFYFFLLFIGSSMLIFLAKPLMSILVSSDFFEAWKYIPLLLLTVVFSSVSGFLGAQYVAMKNTVGIFKTTIVGACANIILNIILIPKMGLQGVGLSSFISFFIVWLLRHIAINKKYNLNSNKVRIFIVTFLLVLQSLFAILNLGYSTIIVQIIIIFIILLIYKDKLTMVLSLLKNKIIFKK